MEFPHNAVLLLCSSYDSGCRPYMCGTSHRHSNCLDQYQKACTKVRFTIDFSMFPGTVWNTSDLPQVSELACPLCRGLVKGWTVVESARKYLNKKKRNCMQDGCSFIGKFKELEEHVKSEHLCANPREVDPVREERWRMLELESERQDAISTLTSTVFGGNGGFGRSFLDIWRLDYERPIDDVNVVANISSDISIAYSSVGHDDAAVTARSGGGSLGILRAQGRHNRRRRRSRGPSPFDEN